jgi:hypothetical protein
MNENEQLDYHHSENLWEILTLLRMPDKPKKNTSKRESKKNMRESFLEKQSIVEKLSLYERKTLECAKAEVEYKIEDGRILVAAIASFGVVVGYLFAGTWLQILAVPYFGLLGIFTHFEIGKRNRSLSLLKQALVLKTST